VVVAAMTGAMQMKRMLVGAALGLGLLVVGAAERAGGAVLVLDSSVRVSSTVATPVDLTAQGTLDWAYWAPTGSGLTPPVAPTNEKLASTIISSMSNVGGTTLRGSASSTTTERYSWTDGTSPVSGTNASLAGLIFNSDLGSSANGKGLAFTIAGDPAVTRVVTLYLGAFAATGNLTVSLPGAAPITDSTQVFANSSPKQMQVYTLHFQTDSLADTLLVQWTASSITDVTNGHVGAQAVTVGVPEPGSIGVAALGLVGMLARRGRRGGKVG
jgi:hypothetical protein